MSRDLEIRNDVERELYYNFGPAAAGVGVAVEDGIVTLSGVVEMFSQKQNALHAAERVTHVRAVASEIQVRLSREQQRGDPDLARTAANVLSWNSLVPAGRIRISVENGWIALEGTVDWRYQKDAAADAVVNLMGVKGVNDRLRVNPALNSESIKEEIDAALKRSATIDDRNILVDVDNDKVVLHGEVGSLPEREEAERIAWAAPGVADVANHIMVSALVAAD